MPIIISFCVLLGMVWLFAWVGFNEAQKMQGEIVAGVQYVQTDPLALVWMIAYIVIGFVLLFVCLYLLRWLNTPPEHRDNVENP